MSSSSIPLVSPIPPSSQVIEPEVSIWVPHAYLAPRQVVANTTSPGMCHAHGSDGRIEDVPLVLQEAGQCIRPLPSATGAICVSNASTGEARSPGLLSNGLNES